MKKEFSTVTYPDWHRLPFRLTKQEIDRPNLVIKNFLEDYDLPTLRRTLDDCLNRILLTKVADPLDYIWFKEELERFLEACHVQYDGGRMTSKKKAP